MFGRKRHILDVIQYEGPADVFVWKHRCEDFNTKSQLIVHESQEAVFYKNGQALDTFLPGRYTLNTQNIPLLRSIIGLPTGGTTPFHCEVYYINKAVSMGMPWGTDSPIEMEEPQYKFIYELKAGGDFSLRVLDGRKLLKKLVGTLSQFTHDEIKKYFSEIIASHMRECITRTMIDRKIGPTQVNTQLRLVSEEIWRLLTPVFIEYGLELNHFVVSSIKPIGLEKYKEMLEKVTLKTIEATGDAQVTIIEASGDASAERLRIGTDTERTEAEGVARSRAKLAEGSADAQIFKMQGITGVEVRAFDVADILAGNRGPEGTAINGILSGAIAPNAPAGKASDIVTEILNRTKTTQPTVPVAPPEDDFKRRLEKLKMLKGEIPDDLYNIKLKELMDSI